MTQQPGVYVPLRALFLVMQTGKMQASQHSNPFISTRVHQWSGGTDGHCAHREITFNR